MPDPYNLDRFVEAQDLVYPRVCAELSAGRKTSHWMWFVFPQRGIAATKGEFTAETQRKHKRD